MESDSLAPWRKVNSYGRSFYLEIAMALVFLRSFCWNEYYKEINETCLHIQIRVHPCHITLVQEPRQVISFSLLNLLNFTYQKKVSKQNVFFCLFPKLWDKKTCFGSNLPFFKSANTTDDCNSQSIMWGWELWMFPLCHLMS